MHLAQTMIKGSAWESVLFPNDETPSTRRMLQRYWHDVTTGEADRSAREDHAVEQCIESRRASSVAYLEQRRKEKQSRDNGPEDVA